MKPSWRAIPSAVTSSQTGCCTRRPSETLLLGAQTMRDAISDFIPGANFISRPRLSKLTYSGEKKITRLPARSAIIAFSAQDVYAVAELIRRQRGGAAVMLGALSPRTRNAQVALYQSGGQFSNTSFFFFLLHVLARLVLLVLGLKPNTPLI